MPFPKDFLWGTATSAHQVEGNNKNSDWWEWEQSKDYSAGVDKFTHQKRPWPLEPSGDACDSYNRYEEDFDLCVSMHNNAVRISIEWARLEPEEGKFSDEEFTHYRKVLEAARKRGLKTFVTLHHFTNPIWIAKKGGWENREIVKYFERYAGECTKRLGDVMDSVMTINESLVLASQAYIKGEWYPAKKNMFLATSVALNLIIAHRRAYSTIKKIKQDLPVGIVHHYIYYQTGEKKLFLIDSLLTKLLSFGNNHIYLIATRNHTDFIGINYYFTSTISFMKSNNIDDWLSDMKWWINPKGLENLLTELKRYKLPIYITENGLADAKDEHRPRFLKEMISACESAIAKGVDLRGYFYWSLLDNYEWHHGFWPRFGLVEIDRANGLKRVPRRSAKIYSDLISKNSN